MKRVSFIIAPIICFVLLFSKNSYSEIISPTNFTVKYVCHNANKTDEFLRIDFFNDNDINEIYYSSSVAKKELKLTISKKELKYAEVMFPNSKAVYKLSFEGETVKCTNPDKSVQIFNQIMENQIGDVKSAIDTLQINKKIHYLSPSSLGAFSKAVLNEDAPCVNDPVIKNNGFLISCANGKVIELNNVNKSETEVTEYKFLKSFKSINCALFSEMHYEGYSLLLIDYNDGATYNVCSDLIFSPDMSGFVTNSCGIFYFAFTNKMEYWTITNGKIKLAWEKTIEKEWGPDVVRWINNDEIIIKQCSPQTSEGTEKYVKMKIK
ncbi:MAG: hypothetical protein HXX09_10135 [Bacteroidetes bacterium]|nr:hypothetical protein [Bacteroidota bacterium]